MFNSCESLKEFVFPEGITEIPKQFFKNCNSLTRVQLPKSITTIGYNNFYYESVIKDVYYLGSEADWKNVTVESNNFNLDNALIHYNTKMPVPSGTVTSKKPNPVKVTTKAVTIKAKKLKSKKQTVKPLTIKSAKGTVKVTKVKSGTTSKIYKKVTVNKTSGAITFKKGKYSKKTYKVNLKITVSGNSDYKSKSLSKTVSVKVK